MLINIKLALVSKDWKDKITNLMETVLEIIRHFEFMEERKQED